MPKPEQRQRPSKLQYAALMMAIEISTLLGTEVIPALLFQAVANRFLSNATAQQRVRGLVTGGWASFDNVNDGYRIHVDRMPPNGDHLFGPDAPVLPDDAAENLLSHWKAGITALGDAHMTFPHGAPPSAGATATTQKAEPTQKKETKMVNGPITADPASWPKRPLERGGSYEVFPSKMLVDVELDDTDTRIIDAIIGQPNEADLRKRVMCLRRLSPGQVDGWRAKRTRERNRATATVAHAEPAPKPAPPASPPAPPPSAIEPTELNANLGRAIRAIEAHVADHAGGFTVRDITPALTGAGVTGNPSTAVADLRNRGLLEITGEIPSDKPGRRASVHRLTGRPYRLKEPTAPAPPPANALPTPPPEPLNDRARYGSLIPEERALLDALREERAKLVRIDEKDLELQKRIPVRRAVRAAKRNGIDSRIAELLAKGGIT